MATQSKNNPEEKELEWIAGAYGPLGRVPLLEDLIGESLLNMVVIACARLGFPSGIFQNNGKLFPAPRMARFKFFTRYCQAIRSTNKGHERCKASDCQGVMRFTGGDKVEIKQPPDELMKRSPISEIVELAFSDEKVRGYVCHAGLVELIRPICLDFENGSPIPVGAIWAGQKRREARSLSDDDVRDVAEKIGYAKPEELVRRYKKITPAPPKELNNLARMLADVACSLEDAASKSFRIRKQGKLDRLTARALDSLRRSLNEAKERPTQTIQEKTYAGMNAMLRDVAEGIGNCYSSVCEIPKHVDEMDDSRIEVPIVAQAGVCSRRIDKILPMQAEFRQLCSGLQLGERLQSFSGHSLDSGFLGELKRATQIYDLAYALVGYVPAIENEMLWITLLRDDCDALMPSGEPLPYFVNMFHNLLQSIVQIIDVACLVAKQQDAVRTLRKQAHQLEEKDAQTRLLIRNIAHQVSTPIMGLKLAAYVLIRKEFTETAHKSFLSCLAEMERAARNFDMYEKVVTGFGIEGTVQPLLVADILRDACNRVKVYARAGHVPLSITTQPGALCRLPHVLGDKDVFLDSLINVFHNAIKYSLGDSPPEVHVTHNEQTGNVEIRVINLGIQIPECDRERVFDEGFRCDTAKTVHVQGSGVGLYVSRKLIELHGGSVQVESCVPAQATATGKARWKTTFLITLATKEKIQ